VEETAPAELFPPPAIAEETPAEGAVGDSRGAGIAGGAGAAGRGSGRRTGMSDADYTALIMRRLEEKKIYPLAMRKRGITGDVEALFTIRPDGSLGSLRAGDAPAHPFLAQAALETVRSAAPFPVMEGRAEEYFLRVTIRFRLE
jgi:protein TonB